MNLFDQGIAMILATTIFMTAIIGLDRVPDAFAFFCQTSSLAEALEILVIPCCCGDEQLLSH